MSNNLPPGVTEADIDRHFGGGAEDTFPLTLECNHEDKQEQLGEQRDIPTKDVHDFDGLPTLFSDRETASIAVHWGSWGATVNWTCAVCGQEREEEFEKEDFLPDPEDRW